MFEPTFCEAVRPSLKIVRRLVGGNRRSFEIRSNLDICRALGRDGRVVEGAVLEKLYGGNLIVGSNPTLSALPL